MKIAVIGNCQAYIARIISVICRNSTCTQIHWNHIKKLISMNEKIDLSEYDYIFSALTPDKELDCVNNIDKKISFYPNVVFRGSHPDCIYVRSNSKTIKSPIGDYHSAIIFNSYSHGLTEKECRELFIPEFFNLLGFGEQYYAHLKALSQRLTETGLDGDYLTQKWAALGHFMHTINHPKLFVLEDIAKHLLDVNQINYDQHLKIDDFLSDPYKTNVIFPIYPSQPMSKKYHNGLVFKIANDLTQNHYEKWMSLNDFIHGSYQIYKENESLEPDIKISDNFKRALESISGKATIFFKHPYKDLPDHSYWSRAVSSVEPSRVNPALEQEFLLTSETKIATAGSCFAQHVSKFLLKSNMNYYVSELGPENFSEEDKKKAGYGVFSARYGNIYTARQLLQLIDRALGFYEPCEKYWKTKEGYFVDPFRPNIGEFFNSPEEVLIDLQKHLSKVKEMFTNLDVFVFTLGLTETWENTNDNAVYPVAPGVISNNPDNCQYRFINFDYEDTLGDLSLFIDRLRKINRKAKIILTVSPVPLIATKEKRHVLTSTVASKSILRAVADNLNKAFDFVSYFPSYEIITGNFNRGSYYADDLRSIQDSGINHVMQNFMNKYVHNTSTNISEMNKSPYLIMNEARDLDALSQVICDEELLIDNI